MDALRFILMLHGSVTLSMVLAAAAAAAMATNCTDDLSALLAFKAHVSDPSGFLSSNWTPNTSFCHWAGVSCSRRRQRVTALVLSNVTLGGHLATELGCLSFLSFVGLRQTGLTGMIPSELGQLNRLRYLSLPHNSLSGAIPASLGNLTRLEALYLHSNNLTGEIPQELCNLRNIQNLWLSRNQISGEIPQGLFNHTKELYDINFGFNILTGPIPSSIGSLPKLRFLVLQKNQLTGIAPPAIFNISSLEEIYLVTNDLSGHLPGNDSFHLPMLREISLSENQFVGPFPMGFSASRNLQILSLSSNNFTDIIPKWLTMLPQLTDISLGGNDLFGEIPTDIGNLTNLAVLDLSSCFVHGTIPQELGQLRKLWWFNLRMANISGTIPESIGNISSINRLALSLNFLTGSVPSSFGNIVALDFLDVSGNLLQGDLSFLEPLHKCRALRRISIHENFFSGNLPSSIGNLSALEYFDAQNNLIRGEIPSTVANLSNLMELVLRNNYLRQKIPVSITCLTNLAALDLSFNSMFGGIPVQVGRLSSLYYLRLDSNKFTGAVPTSLSNLSQLQYLYITDNLMSSNIYIPTNLDKLLELNFSHNYLTGTLPSNIGNMKAISRLDLLGNQLYGSLPISIGELVMLTDLDLSNNSFQGEIPQTFGNLLNIKLLNLSSNELSGTIPKTLSNLTQLTSLNLSFNRLEGQIPMGGVFSSNISFQSLMGNAALCGLPAVEFPPCLNDSRHSRSKLWLLEVIIPAVAGIGIIAICLYFIAKAKTEVPVPSDPVELINYRSVSYHELARATDNFCENSLIGVGSYSKVFKGTLDDSSVVAIKVFNLDQEGAYKSFDAECAALRMARHRNLVKILSTCSSLDFKALVLPYFPNGSLDNQLYSGHTMEFVQRVNIMLDVAMGMNYLLHEHTEVILHRDLKPTNVLLDENLTAHVADFGIAKMFLGNGNSIISASMPGTLGYMAPEYGLMGKSSPKSDVFSFGITLLEVFSGKRPTDPMFEGDLNLREWINQAFPSNIADVVDQKLFQGDGTRHRACRGNIALESSSNDSNTCLQCIVELGLICTKESPEERTTMSDVVAKLKKIKQYHLKNCGSESDIRRAAPTEA